MSRTKNIFSMLFYGVKLKMINLLALLINLAILAYTTYDTYKKSGKPLGQRIDYNHHLLSVECNMADSFYSG